MPYTARVIHTKIKDTDGLDITFDLLAGNYTKETLNDNESDSDAGDDGDGDGG